MSPAEGVLLIACLLGGVGLGGWLIYWYSRSRRRSVGLERRALRDALHELLAEAVPHEAQEPDATAPEDECFQDPKPLLAGEGGETLLDLALGQQGLTYDAVRVAVLEERLRNFEKDLGLLRGEQVGEGKVVAVVLYVLASIAAVAIVAVELAK